MPAQAWEWGDVRGPIVAAVLTPESAVRAIKAAKSPLVLIGSEAANFSDQTISLIAELVKTIGAPTIVTVSAVQKALKARGISVEIMSAVELVDRLLDGDWSLSKESHDLVIFVGVPYQLQTQLLSALKNFAPTIKRLSLDRYFTPNATLSFPNLPKDKWLTALQRILIGVKS